MNRANDIKRTMEGNRTICVLIVSIALLFGSCGYKTDLNPPEPRRIERVAGLRSEIKCSGIQLEWSPVLFDTRGDLLSEPASYLVLRKRGEPVKTDTTVSENSDKNQLAEHESDDTESDESQPMDFVSDDDLALEINSEDYEPDTAVSAGEPDESEIPAIPPEYAFSLVAIVPGQPVSLTTPDLEQKTVEWEDTGVPNGPVLGDIPRRFRRPRGFPPDSNTDEGLIPGYVYSYSVVAIDSNYITSLPSPLENAAWVIIPGPPENFESNVELNQVQLSWTPPSVDCKENPMETDIKRYEVFRSEETEPEQFKKVLTVSNFDNLAGNDTNIAMDTIYYYQIRAVIEPSVPGQFSEAITVDTVNIFPPEPPVQLSGAVRPGGVFLNWRFEGEADIAGYRIYRKHSDQPEYDLLNPTVLVTGRMYVDDTVESGQTYTYRVTAVDRSVNRNESPPGNSWTVTVR